jgi:hypothetical protein
MTFAPNPDDSSGHPAAAEALLWSIRAWVFGVCRDIPVDGRIRDVLAGIGAPAAADPLLGLLCVIGDGTSRRLRIACICDRGILPDERLLLDIISMYQYGRNVEAMFQLRSILGPRAALAARDSAARLASVLIASGHLLAPPGAPPVQHRALVAEEDRPAPPPTLH